MRDGVLWDHAGPVAVGIPSCISAMDELLMNHFSISSPTDDTSIPRSPEAITAVAWAPDGSVAVSGNQIGELILWKDAKAVATAQVSWGSHSSDSAGLGSCLVMLGEGEGVKPVPSKVLK